MTSKSPVQGLASYAPRPQRRPKGKRGPPPAPERKRDLKRKREAEDLESLAARVAALDTSDAGAATGSGAKTFAELPLSSGTAAGLEASHFVRLTEVQRRAIPAALQGHDVLGAAKTGSGKTLAFLVPVLEALYRARWTEHDGLGALVLAPTRELAIQIFEVLRKIGRKHAFSAGLVIGGKSVRDEAERLARINILISTPGRMLQHLDQTAMFDVSGLRILVLDEADRILDLGFQTTVDAILDHLPSQGRQTLLFSATQTRKVGDLARLSLREPRYVAVHQDAAAATPAKLQQNYVVVRLPDKLDTLWGFIRTNLKAKTLVFVSSGKQVRFIYEAFRHLQPGVPLLHLHGRQRQAARLEIVTRFAKATTACLFATDVAARGLDFPAVDWVVQLDCPEDADTYIHRVGRTARFEKEGRAVMFLDPSEAPAMAENLRRKKVPVEEIRVRQKKQLSIKNQLQSMCFRDPELKYLGQKAVISYAKSINVQKDKSVFKINELPLDEFAASLGLPGAPRIKFRKGDDVKAIKNASRAAVESSSSGEDSEADGKPKAKDKKEVRTKYDRMFERRNQDVLAPHYASMVGDESAPATTQLTAAADDEHDFLTVKRRLSFSPAGSGSDSDSEQRKAGNDGEMKKLARKGQDPLLIDSKRREKLLKSKKKLLKYKEHGHKLVFDDDGNAHEIYELQDEDAFAAEGAPAELRRRFVDGEQQSMAAADDADKALAKDKKRAKREKRKQRERAEKEAAAGAGAVLVPFEGEAGEDLQGSDADDGYDEGSVEDRASENEDSASVVGEAPAKKWFQQDEGRARKKRRANVPEEAETLEDLEELATRYL